MAGLQPSHPTEGSIMHRIPSYITAFEGVDLALLRPILDDDCRATALAESYDNYNNSGETTLSPYIHWGRGKGEGIFSNALKPLQNQSIHLHMIELDDRSVGLFFDDTMRVYISSADHHGPERRGIIIPLVFELKPQYTSSSNYAFFHGTNDIEARVTEPGIEGDALTASFGPKIRESEEQTFHRNQLNALLKDDIAKIFEIFQSAKPLATGPYASRDALAGRCVLPSFATRGAPKADRSTLADFLLDLCIWDAAQCPQLHAFGIEPAGRYISASGDIESFEIVVHTAPNEIRLQNLVSRYFDQDDAPLSLEQQIQFDPRIDDDACAFLQRKELSDGTYSAHRQIEAITRVDKLLLTHGL